MLPARTISGSDHTPDKEREQDWENKKNTKVNTPAPHMRCDPVTPVR